MSEFTICQIVIDSSRPNHQIAIPKNLLTTLSVKVGDRMRVKVSNRSEQALVTQSADTHIHMSNQLAKVFRLKGGRLSVRTQPRQRNLQLGPIVALYVIGNERREPPFPDTTKLIADLIRLGDELGVYVYAVTPGSFNFINHTVYGARIEGSTWRWGEQPFPEVVFRRAVTFPKRLFQTARQELKLMEKGPNIQLFGKDIGDKWDVYTLLKENSNQLVEALPETFLYTQPKLILEQLHKHPVVYLKPARGTQGKGILRVSRRSKGNNMYAIEKANNSNKPSTKIVRRSDLLEGTVLQQLKPSQRYLVQQGIDLLQHQQRIVDFRWLVQKRVDQSWIITARICRIAKSKQIATNLHMGGQVVPAEDVLNISQNQWNKSMHTVIEQIDKLAIETAKTLDQKISGNVEFGIDFAIDKDGKTWILEVNPRPGRKMLRLCQPEIRKQSLLRPLEYAKYATGFNG